MGHTEEGEIDEIPPGSYDIVVSVLSLNGQIIKATRNISIELVDIDGNIFKHIEARIRRIGGNDPEKQKQKILAEISEFIPKEQYLKAEEFIQEYDSYPAFTKRKPPIKPALKKITEVKFKAIKQEIDQIVVSSTKPKNSERTEILKKEEKGFQDEYIKAEKYLEKFGIEPEFASEASTTAAIGGNMDIHARPTRPSPQPSQPRLPRHPRATSSPVQ